MAHGTPSSLDEMPEYLRLVRGGRPPSDELVAEMRHNYAAIGGRSPLTELTLAQAEALAARLGPAIPVAVGMRNWRPFIGDAIAQLAAGVATRIIGDSARTAVLVAERPQVSRRRARGPARRRGVSRPVGSYHDHPRLVQAFAERVAAAGPAPDEDVDLHGAQPSHARHPRGRPLRRRGGAHGARDRQRASRLRRYRRAFQSAGRTPEPWIGLDLSDLLARSGAARRDAVPHRADRLRLRSHRDPLRHRRAGGRHGARARRGLRRTESLNTLPTFITLLEELVRARL